MAMDILIPHRFLFENEFVRLAGNLTILAVSSIMTCPAYFILSETHDGATAIGAGFILISVPSIVYMILFLGTCCVGNCKDKTPVRVVLAVLIVIGGVVTAVGYYIYAGDPSALATDADDAKRVAYYIGYTILVGGLCLIWALDIAWDDIKND